MDDETQGMSLMTDDECWQVLAGEEVGRLVTITDDMPGVYPLNYGTEEGTIYFLTRIGSKYRAMQTNPKVGFQVDAWSGEEGWSVVADGVAREVVEPQRSAVLGRVHLNAWVQGGDPRLMAIDVHHVSGRRFTFVPSSTTFH